MSETGVTPWISGDIEDQQSEERNSVTKSESARRDRGTACLTRWVHTGIEAPYKLGVQGFAMLETGRGVAYSAEMIHPEHGVIGRISNEGCGGPTMFHSYDYKKFSDRDLDAFAAQCRQDGDPLDPHGLGLGVETPLDEVINEGEYADFVAEMRRDGRFLVRSFEPRTEDNYGVRRGPALVYTQPVLWRTARENLAAELAKMPEHRLAEAAFWQMFNGQEWVPLLPEPALTAGQATARISDLVTLHLETTKPNEVLNGRQLDDGLHVFSTPDISRFTLIGDTTFYIDSKRWCQCERRVAKPVRFERWSVHHGLLESGTAHGAKSCRRLVTVD